MAAEENESAYNMYRDKVLLRRKVAPRRVTLPIGHSFLAGFERVSQKNLPSNVTIRRSQTIGPRGQRKRKTQIESGLLGNVFSLDKNLLTSGALTKSLSKGSKALNSELGNKLIDEGIKITPELYKYSKIRVTNKTLKRALESDAANYIAEKAEENLFG